MRQKHEKKKKIKKVCNYTTVIRPWGFYTVLYSGAKFKVKVIEVSPHKALSLQFHKKRSEHWVVLEGRAKIVKNKKTYFFNANQSIDVPVKCVHRLSNIGKKPLKIIEVQSGTYLGEDDIVR
ncbi:MAG: phosphomannose isomerase type II C-terminal cupin domain [Candidatus Omnitrophota bacterium]